MVFLKFGHTYTVVRVSTLTFQKLIFFLGSTVDIEFSKEMRTDDEENRERHEMLVNKSLLQPTTRKFGEWEQYTNVS